jgi:hypothetical protein
MGSAKTKPVDISIGKKTGSNETIESSIYCFASSTLIITGYSAI